MISQLSPNPFYEQIRQLGKTFTQTQPHNLKEPGECRENFTDSLSCP